jgi:hypothetical protein
MGRRFIDNSNLGDSMRRNIIRSVAITTVLGGTIFGAVGVAAADQGRPTGGDNSSAQSGCNSSDLDFDRGCFLNWGPFFRK